MLTKFEIRLSVFKNSLLHSSNSSMIASNSSSLFKAVVAIMDGPPSISVRRMERTDIDSAAGSIVGIQKRSVRKRNATLYSLGKYY